MNCTDIDRWNAIIIQVVVGRLLATGNRDSLMVRTLAPRMAEYEEGLESSRRHGVSMCIHSVERTLSVRKFGSLNLGRVKPMMYTINACQNLAWHSALM